MSAKDVNMSREIAHVWNTCQRVICQLTKICLLNSVIPISQGDLLDEYHDSNFSYS